MEQIARLIRPWATLDGPEGLDSMVMEARDRTANLAFFAAAAIVWVLVGVVVTTRDPIAEPSAGFVGAMLIGLAVALTIVPLAWLTVFGRHRQIAYRGDWTRAIRRAAWVGSSWRSSWCSACRVCSSFRSPCSSSRWSSSPRPSCRPSAEGAPEGGTLGFPHL